MAFFYFFHSELMGTYTDWIADLPVTPPEKDTLKLPTEPSLHRVTYPSELMLRIAHPTHDSTTTDDTLDRLDQMESLLNEINTSDRNRKLTEFLLNLRALWKPTPADRSSALQEAKFYLVLCLIRRHQASRIKDQNTVLQKECCLTTYSDQKPRSPAITANQALIIEYYQRGLFCTFHGLNLMIGTESIDKNITHIFEDHSALDTFSKLLGYHCFFINQLLAAIHIENIITTQKDALKTEYLYLEKIVSIAIVLFKKYADLETEFPKKKEKALRNAETMELILKKLQKDRSTAVTSTTSISDGSERIPTCFTILTSLTSLPENTLKTTKEISTMTTTPALNLLTTDRTDRTDRLVGTVEVDHSTTPPIKRRKCDVTEEEEEDLYSRPL